MKRKRSQEKKITSQAKILRFMRLTRGLSQKRVAILCDLSEQAIGHYENGRMDISAHRLERFLAAYRFNAEEYAEYLSGKKEIPVLKLKDECTQLLDRIDESKLKTIHSVLLGFIS